MLKKIKPIFSGVAVVASVLTAANAVAATPVLNNEALFSNYDTAVTDFGTCIRDEGKSSGLDIKLFKQSVSKDRYQIRYAVRVKRKLDDNTTYTPQNDPAARLIDTCREDVLDKAMMQHQTALLNDDGALQDSRNSLAECVGMNKSNDVDISQRELIDTLKTLLLDGEGNVNHSDTLPPRDSVVDCIYDHPLAIAVRSEFS
jgi:hypothetical protein